MNIATLKQEARALEQQGRAAEALALYRKALARLEGTQEIWRELPLYVKAGDLNLKLNDGKTAIAMYERAAKRYAQYGSGKSVLALCSKILRVSPSRLYVFLAFARLMIERGHVAEAAKVMAGYAELTKLGKAREVIQNLADREPDEVKPVLEMLLEVAGRAENARLKAAEQQREGTDQPARGTPEEPEAALESASETDVQVRPAPAASPVRQAPVDEVDEVVGAREAARRMTGDTEGEARAGGVGSEAESEPEEPERLLAASGPGIGEAQSTDLSAAPEEPRLPEGLAGKGEDEARAHESFEVIHGSTPVIGVGGLYRPEPAGGNAAGLDFSPTIEPPPRRESADRSQEQAEPAPPLRTRDRPGGATVSARQPVSRTGPRPQLTFTTAKPKASKRRWPWVALAVMVIGAGGAGLVMAGVVGGGDGGDAGIGEQVPGAAVQQLEDSTAVTAATGDSARSLSEGDTTFAADEGALAPPAEPSVSEVVDTGATDLAPLDRPAGLADSLVQALPDIPVETEVTQQPPESESLAASRPATAELALPSVPAGVSITGPIIVVRGLTIESVTEFPGGGHRVVQLLGSGERLVLTAIPVTDEMPDTSESGVVTVRSMPGASTVGSVRYAEHLVDAQGIVAADTLTMLLGRLAQLRP
ncbi:MAG: hypothetical protein JSW71_21130 [Gemmatimonadota bacterium]|nr:MAG: hypothetical protein JSW71_21130 [Gemmatimonadota bacterium]